MPPPQTSDHNANVQRPQKDPKWQYLCTAMEHALSLGDIQKDPANAYAPEEFCALALDRIGDIIDFDASAIYIVESDTSLESIEYVTLLNQKNALLCKEIDDKVEQILHKERQIAFNRKLNAIASLAGGIAHELNNALTALTGYNDLTKIHYQDAQNVLKFTENSSPLLDRLTSLTQKLLSYSRGGKYKTEAVSIQTLIDRCLHHFKNKLENRIGISVNFQHPDILIKCDVTQIKEVLRAVITNAIEAIKEKGKIDITVKKTAPEVIPANDPSNFKPGMYAAMEIKDNGCGMDQNTRDRIFEPFFSTKFVGRGLSMAAVLGIVENHHGAIFVDSVPERETIVTIYLPLE